MTRNEFKKIITDLSTQLGRFPLIQEIADKLGVPAYKIPPLLKYLVEDGWLIRVGNNYRMASTPIVDSLRPDVEPPALPPPNPLPATIPNVPGKSGASLEAIRWVLLVIGIGAIIGSTYYTAIWMRESNPNWLAWILSVIIVMFSTAAFDVVVAMVSGAVTKQWWRWLLAGGFLALWLVVLSFSIGSTIAGQYNRHAYEQAQKARVSSGAQADASLVQASQDAVTRAQQTYEDARRYLNQLISQSSIEGGLESTANWRTTQAQLARQIKEQQAVVAQAESILARAEAERVQAIQNHPEASQAHVLDFYGWLAKAFRADRDQIQFWMNLFPAVFLDIIAPAALAIFLFMKRRETK